MRIAFATILALASSMARGQAPAYGGALLYSMSRQTSVPPLYVGQPSQVMMAYLWLDDLMRLDPEYRIEAYIKSLSWNDTAKTIASYLYQIQDDNPLSYYDWDGTGIYPHPYKGAPGRAELAFITHAWQSGGTIPGVFLTSEIIADVIVSDTVCNKDVFAHSAKDAVLVNCVINDEIKGKFVPSCPSYPSTRKKGASPQNDTTIVFPLTALGTAFNSNFHPNGVLGM